MLRRLRMSAVVGMGLAMAGLGGCQPEPGDLGVALVVTPEELNFGFLTELATIQVDRTFSSSYAGPVVASSPAPWINIENCTSLQDGCTLPLEGQLPVIIPVTVDRTKSKFGTNRALITLSAVGAPNAEVEVIMEDQLEVDFEVDLSSIEAGQTIRFFDRSRYAEGTEDEVAWLWEFGDGVTSTAREPQHRFSTDGRYSVSLTVTTDAGTETVRREGFIQVGEPGGSGGTSGIDAEFTADQRTVFAGQPVSFTNLSRSQLNPITRYEWDFGDGGTSNMQNPVHTYETSGVFTVTLRVITDAGADTEIKNSFVVVQQTIAPQAQFGVSSTATEVNFPISFVDQSQAGSSPITSWQWNFGDGTSSTEQNPSHRYTVAGTYTVTLTVTSAHGTSTSTLAVNVANRPPVADFTVDKNDPSVFEFVQFSDQSQAGSFPIVRWEWNFGDGETSSERNPRHRYATQGVYSVTLTVFMNTDTNSSDTEVKENFITVINPPTPEFSFAPRTVYVGTTVRFSDLTVPGSETALTYQWDLDGNPTTTTDRSTQRNPSFTYTEAGTFDVTLRVSTPTRSAVVCHPVVVDKAPDPDFSATPVAAFTNEPVQFTETTVAGVSGRVGNGGTTCTGTLTGNQLGALPIESRTWNFGDGQTSTATNPQHAYAQPGQYTVTLTLSYRHSLSGEMFTAEESKAAFITVADPTPPTASFSIVGAEGTTCIPVGGSVTFANTSEFGSATSGQFLWDFGDGTTSTEQNPTHVYLEEGSYDVSLTVTTPARFAPFNTDTFTRTGVIRVGGETTALDDYVNAIDPSYDYDIIAQNTVVINNILTSVPTTMNVITIRMISQTWRTTADYVVTADGSATWQHNMTVIAPPAVRTNTGMLFINGGSNFSSAPDFTNLDEEEEALLQMSALSNSVITLLDQVPNQPLQFADEPDRTRSEDEAIAYTYRKYLESVDAGAEDNTWPLLLPMVKSAVRAMDTVQDLSANGELPPCNTCTTSTNPVDDFVVTGGSKRGWTTWLTGAVDDRVKAIAPLVIDVLNMDEQMRHHFAAYGWWAPAIYPYAQERVFDRVALDDDAAARLLNIVDPFEYRCRLDMPKYIMNSTGDQFFLPDSSQFYFDRLEGDDNLLNYVPNTDHGLSGELDISNPNSPARSLLVWYISQTNNLATPEYSWNFEDDGSIVVTVPTGEGLPTLRSASMYQATNPTARDFRLDTIDAAWTRTTLNPQSPGRFVASINPPATGWTAFFVQLRFQNPANPTNALFDYVVSTAVRVLPETEDGGQLYPEFDGDRVNLSNGIRTVPRVRLYGTPEEMGAQYGRLLSDEINAFIPEFLDVAQQEPGFENSTLDSLWEIVAADNLRFVSEVYAVAAASGIDQLTLQRANMVPVLSDISGHAVAAAGPRLQDEFLQSSGLEWSPELGLLDSAAIAVYVPGIGQGLPHVNVGWPGLIGSFTGGNLSGVVISTVPNPDQAGDPEISTGTHVSILNRDLLYDAIGLPQARAMVEESELIRRTHLVVGDGRFFLDMFKARANEFDRPNDVVIWGPGDPADEFAPNTIFDAVYSVTRPQDAPLVFDIIRPANSPALFADDFFEVRDAVNAANTSGNEEVLHVLYDPFPHTPELSQSFFITASWGDEPTFTFPFQSLLP